MAPPQGGGEVYAGAKVGDRNPRIPEVEGEEGMLPELGDNQRPLPWQRPKWIQQPIKVGHYVECPPLVARGRALFLKLL